MIILDRELSTKSRDKLPDSDFALPKERKYPIPDESHARNALARVAQHGTDAERKTVRAAVHKKFPSIEISEAATMIIIKEFTDIDVSDAAKIVDKIVKKVNRELGVKPPFETFTGNKPPRKGSLRFRIALNDTVLRSSST